MAEDFVSLRERSERMYKSIGSVYCPYFKSEVIFNTEGLNHVSFKGLERPRPPADQRLRFKHLHYAPEVLKMSKTIQGVRDGMSFERVRRNNRTDILLVRVTYYEFIAILDDRRFKVIVKQVENGRRFFWSIIPFWKVDGQGRRILSSGNLATD